MSCLPQSPSRFRWEVRHLHRVGSPNLICKERCRRFTMPRCLHRLQFICILSQLANNLKVFWSLEVPWILLICSMRGEKANHRHSSLSCWLSWILLFPASVTVFRGWFQNLWKVNHHQPAPEHSFWVLSLEEVDPLLLFSPSLAKKGGIPFFSMKTFMSISQKKVF